MWIKSVHIRKKADFQRQTAVQKNRRSTGLKMWINVHKVEKNIRHYLRKRA
jgi:hypothetical protein